MSGKPVSDEAPRLTVAVATTAARVGQTTLPPPMPGVDYLVTVQADPDGGTGCAAPPDWSTRSDVGMLHVPSGGLSRNRNAGLLRATGPLVLFSDDDIRLDLEGIERLRAAFAVDAELALALGWRTERAKGQGMGRGDHRLTRYNTGHACAPEFVVLRDAVLAAGIRFDEGFGIGAAIPLGEDYIFVCDILSAGLRGRGLPVATGTHNGPSSGDRWDDPALLAARQAVLRRALGRYAVPIGIAYGWRHRAKMGGGLAWLRFVLGLMRPEGLRDCGKAVTPR